MTDRPPAIFPAHRAIEHAVSVPGLHPPRYFGVLWPLWQVEISGRVDDPQAYEVIDRFVERAIHEAGLRTTAAIADFLGLPPSLVDGCVRYLVTIGHVEERGGQLTLAEPGARSLRDNKRYVTKEARQLLLFDQFTSRPLPRDHYAANVTIISRPRLERGETTDGTQFTPLFAGTWFSDDFVHQLVAHPDRAVYNLPSEIRDIEVKRWTPAFLPVYLVETTRGMLAYSRAGEERDAYIEDTCRHATAIADQLAREHTDDPRTMWIDWAAERRAGLESLRQLPNGIWRCTLPANAYGERPKVPLRRLGSFEVRRQHFLQIWCDDATFRRKAVMDRGARMARARGVDTRAALVARISALATQLEVLPPDLAAIRTYAEGVGLAEAVDRLDQLK
jgi:hypothetical protein